VCRVIPYRGFESRPLRQKHHKKRLAGRFFVVLRVLLRN
jgi:hypothetical protein